jgi:hypothetical protein
MEDVGNKTAVAIRRMPFLRMKVGLRRLKRTLKGLQKS